MLPWFGCEWKYGLVAGNRFWPRASQPVVGRLARSRGKETLRGMLTKQQPGWPQKTTKDLQIIRKIELYWQTTSVSAWLKLWLRIDSVKMHIMASHILFWRGRYEEGKSRRVQFIVVQRGQFCNIMSMDCYPRWSISQNFPGNRAELYSEGYHMKCRLNEVTPSECRIPLKTQLNSHFHISWYHAKSLVLSLGYCWKFEGDFGPSALSQCYPASGSAVPLSHHHHHHHNHHHCHELQSWHSPSANWRPLVGQSRKALLPPDEQMDKPTDWQDFSRRWIVLCFKHLD